MAAPALMAEIPISIEVVISDIVYAQIDTILIAGKDVAIDERDLPSHFVLQNFS
jgi:hypothetical protein